MDKVGKVIIKHGPKVVKFVWKNGGETIVIEVIGEVGKKVVKKVKGKKKVK